MNFIVQNLTNVPFPEITHCFNEAFSDYFVKFNATEDYLRTRWQGARVDYSLSFGCFSEEQLVGFIMHGIGEREGVKAAHNCATGIEPPYRGQGLLQKMYDEALPALKKNGIELTTLEVISKNERAIKAYEKAGFRLRLKLLKCFSGTLKIMEVPVVQAKIIEVESPDFLKYAAFCDFEPTWELNNEALSAQPGVFRYKELWLDDQLAGYLVHNTAGLVPQFAVHPAFRGKGLGKLLWQHLAAEQPHVRVNNIPEDAEATLHFLQRIGLENHIDQYEMERQV